MEEKESKEIEKVSTKGLRIFISIQLLLLFITIIFLLQNGEYGWSLFMTLPLTVNKKT